VTPSSPAKHPPSGVKKMRAVVLHAYGGLKHVKMGDRPFPPPPLDSQVTIEVQMSGLNFQDLMLRLGLVDIPPQPKTPFVLGTELLGKVTAVGGKVTRCQVDDLVYALPENGGGWTETVNLDEKFVFKVTKPELSLEKLGSTLPYLVAHLLLQRSGVQSGGTVLVHSAGGSVGLAVRDLAKLRDINVIGIASTSKHDKLEGFTELIKRGQSDYVSEVRKLRPEGVDAVFDSQGGDDVPKGISLLAPWGMYILYGSANMVTGENRSFLAMAKGWWTQVERVSPLKLFEENKAISGLHLRHLLKQSPQLVQKAMDLVWNMMADGTIEPITDSTFHYETVTLGMQRLHDRKNIGKVLISPEPSSSQTLPPIAEEVTASSASEAAESTKNEEVKDKEAQKEKESSTTAAAAD